MGHLFSGAATEYIVQKKVDVTKVVLYKVIKVKWGHWQKYGLTWICCCGCFG